MTRSRPGAAAAAGSGIVVLPADTVDLDALVALERAAFGSAAWSRRQLAGDLGCGRSLCLLARPSPGRDAAPVGYAIFRAAADEAELLRVGVAPQRRRRGVARGLIAAGLATLAAAGCRRCYLEVAAGNLPAITLYHQLGFDRCGRRRGYYRGGGDALLFERALGGGDAAGP